MTSRTSLLIVGNFLSKSGRTPNVCEDLAGRLRGIGWSVVTTSEETGRTARLLDMLGTVWRKRHHYRLATIDTFSGPAFLWAELVAQALHALAKPCVLILHGGNLPDFARRNPERVTRLLKSAAIVTAPSRYLQESMRQYRGDVRLLPNAIDLALYPSRVRANPAPRMIWLRAFHAVYNPSLALRTLAALVREHPEARLTMAGPDKGDGSLQAFRGATEELRLVDRVDYVGLVQKADVPAWLDRGDIFINTTDFDNTPVSVVEAMACGLCVVSTNVGGIPYLLEHEVDALLVPPNDPGAMAAAVKRVLAEPGLAEKLSRNARRKAEGFDWQVALPQWEKLLREAVGPA